MRAIHFADLKQKAAPRPATPTATAAPADPLVGDAAAPAPPRVPPPSPTVSTPR